MMKATLSLFSLIFLFSAPPAFSHGVERGSVMEAINGEGLGGMSDTTKMLVVREIMSRCDLTGLVFVTASVTTDPRGNAGIEESTGNYRIELSLRMEGRVDPVIIRVEASEERAIRLNMINSSVVSLDSPICR